MEIVDSNVAILTCCHGDISVWVLRTTLYRIAEAHSVPVQTSNLDLSETKVNGFKLILLFLLEKSTALHYPSYFCEKS